jgi:hypothetical protein
MMEPSTTTEEGTEMLNPVTLPIPALLAILFALAAGAWAYRRWLENATGWNPWKTPTPRTGRHRMTPEKAADPHRRDWAAAAAERINAGRQDEATAEPAQPEPEPSGLDSETRELTAARR